MKKRLSLIIALAFSCSSVYAANVSDWHEFAGESDIDVTSDIEANTSEKIPVTGTKTINGNSHSLQGVSGSYFDISGAGGDFTFQNFGKLSNGTETNNTFSYTDKSGGVIYKTIDKSVNSFSSSVFQLNNATNASKITIDNSVFYNNSSTSHGGVLNNSPGSTGRPQQYSFDISNSYFVNNSSKRNGGAVYFDGGELNLENTVFSGNTSSGNGGAVHAASSGERSSIINVKNSIFDGNKSTGDLGGGAITLANARKNNPSILRIENSVFANNTADDGGAIKAFNNYSHIEYIKNSVFRNNRTTGWDGGAISSSRLTLIEGSLFQGNVSKGQGGAIWYGLYDVPSVENSDFYIKKTNFIENISNKHAGAVFIQSGTNAHTFHITDSKFINNQTLNNSAGAIYSTSNINYSNTEFTGNKANKQAGAVYTDGYDSTATFDNVTFSNNEAGTLGGGIYSYWSTDTYINSKFDGNKAGSAGGAIFIDESPSTFVDTVFTNNKSDGEAGAIYANLSDINIYANQKDVIFSGNAAAANSEDYNAGNDIYFEADDQTFDLNINASEGKKAVFDGGIASYSEGDGKAILNLNSNDQSYTDINKNTVNVGNTGEIQFNNRIGDASSAFDINLYSGQLSIGQNAQINKTIANPDGFINDNNFNIKGSAALNTVNSVIGEINPNSFIIDDGLKWEYKFDVDLVSKTADKIIGAQNGVGSSVSINNLHFLNAPVEKEFKITYSDKNINGIIDEEYLVVFDKTTYKIKTLNDDDGSHLIMKESAPKGGLAWAVHTRASQYYVNSDALNNNIVDLWFENNYNPDVIDNTVVKDLVIHGRNHDIVSNAPVDGLRIAPKRKLIVNNVNSFNGFDNTFVNKGTLVLNNTSVTNNAGVAAIQNEKGEIEVNADRNIVIDAGKADNAILADGGNISLNGSGTISIKGKVTGSNDASMEIDSDVDFDGALDSINTIQNSSKVNVNDSIQDGSHTLNNGFLNLNGTLTNTDVTLNGGVLNIYNSFNAGDFTLNGGIVNAVNNKFDNMTAKNMNIKGTTDFILDVDLQNKLMDTLSADSSNYTGGSINVKAFNYLSDATESNIKINFANDAIKDYVTTDVTSYMNKIYRYNVLYDKNDGTFNFITPAGRNNYKSFNPAIIASPVAAQLGGYLIILNSYDEAFRNMDMYMLMTKKQREALKYKNKYASVINDNLIYDKGLRKIENPAGWVRPFATFENVPLRNGPKVSNVSYGSFFGGESEMYDLGNGWDGIWGAYAGYNGSHQAYDGIGIYQNGGTLGVVGMAYKGNFYTGLTVNAGANVGEASTMYGNDNFTMLLAGVASKTGYNFEFADGKFILQPHFLMSYSFVNTFDYTNAAGVRINSDPLHAIQLEPGLKIIGNLKNGWQPYASVSMVWNIMDKTHFYANDVSLPELSVKPFVKYGVGVRKSWGERFTGYFQCFIMNGGRNGVGLQSGFNWAIGKAPSSTKTSYKQSQKTEIKTRKKTSYSI